MTETFWKTWKILNLRQLSEVFGKVQKIIGNLRKIIESKANSSRFTKPWCSTEVLEFMKNTFQTDQTNCNF